LPGQFLTLRLPATAGAAPLLRSYSLSGPPAAESYRISVKREPHGAVSYAPDPVDDPADGNALICCSQPHSDLALDL
jgi:ferredoxin-NADP reductase